MLQFEIVEKVGAVAYRIALPSSLSNLHDVFHVSQLRNYVYDESHVIQVDDHVFLRVNPVTGVGRALKCRKLTPIFVGPFEIVEKVGAVAYWIALPPLEVRDNLTVETWPARVEDREVKRLRGKEIVLVKVIWVGPTGESATWESESWMKDSYPEMFPSGNFRGRKFF